MVLDIEIASQTVINRETNEEKRCFFYKLQPDHLDEILSLQSFVTSRMTAKENYVSLSKEEFQFILEGHGLAVGAFVDNTLIGMYALVFPKNEDNHGKLLGISEREFHSVIHSESAFVLPNFQGNRLLFIMKKLAFEQVEEMRRYRYILATIHPNNIASLKAHFSLGLHIVQLRKMYHNLWRYLLIHDVADSFIIDKRTIVEVNIIDKKEQITLFDSGYVGYQLLNKNGQLFLCLAKRL